MKGWIRSLVRWNVHPWAAYKKYCNIMWYANEYINVLIDILTGALLISAAYRLKPGGYIAVGMLILFIIRWCVQSFLPTDTLGLHRKHITHPSYSPPMEHVVVEEFTDEQALNDAENLVRQYVNQVPGVRVKLPKQLPYVWYVPRDILNRWNAVLSNRNGHVAPVHGMYLPVIDTCLVTNEAPYHRVITTTVHELLHHFTRSESEVLYITAYIMYLAGRAAEFDIANALLESNPNATNLWKHQQGGNA